VNSIYKSLDNRSVIIMRHGQSVWNEKNLFTGWEDADLTEAGKLEARKAGQLLKQMKMRFDTAHCSLLRRAIKTLWIALEELDQEWIPVQKDWRLNERHYGHLTGLNKIEMEKKHGALTVKKWRKSYDYKPEPVGEFNPNWNGLDHRYADLEKVLIPKSESLRETLTRVKKYWDAEILRDLKLGKRIIISAHGNSIRALLMYLEKISAEEIEEVNIPRATPIKLQLDESFQVVSRSFLP
jgi:2,3-bisphosphoglycerate-dependent phosphoglycerate mutase